MNICRFNKCLSKLLNIPVLFVTGNFTYFSWYIFSEHTFNPFPEISIRMLFSCYKNNIKNNWDFRWFSPPPFWKFFKKLSTHSTPLCKLKTEWQIWKTRKNGLEWYMECAFFVLKIFWQSIFMFPIDKIKFCKFHSSNCSGCSVRFLGLSE